MLFGEAFGFVFKIVISALIAFAGGLWILSGWFDRRLSGREAFVLGSGLLVLMFYSISLALRGGPGILILFGVVFGTALVLRGLTGYAERSITKRLDDADIAKYTEAIEQYPDNPHAHSLLADVYRRLGEHSLAAEEYEVALKIDPSLKDERYWLEKMRSEIERLGSAQMSCPRCGTVREDAELECLECGRPYSSVETWRHAFETMEPPRRALWLGLALGVAAALTAALTLVQGAGKLVIPAVLLAAPLVIIVMSARMRRRSG
jgi:tetratricopeptide (TPR) repeat protein